MKGRDLSCATCEEKRCERGIDCFGARDSIRPEYDDPTNRAIMQAAGAVEVEGYKKMTRLEELIAFCDKMSVKRVGMAFCLGLHQEAAAIQKALERHGLEVFSVACKACGMDKAELSLPRGASGFEAACNPIGQAILLNRQSTELNVIVGLCMGHDILFTRHSQAPVSTLIVKDRVLAHNPAAVLYSAYHRSRVSL